MQGRPKPFPGVKPWRKIKKRGQPDSKWHDITAFLHRSSDDRFDNHDERLLNNHQHLVRVSSEMLHGIGMESDWPGFNGGRPGSSRIPLATADAAR